MSHTARIKMPNILGRLNDYISTDYIVRLYRTRCNLIPQKIGDKYGACGDYEYRIGGNNGQVDEDVVAAIVTNMATILAVPLNEENENKEGAEFVYVEGRLKYVAMKGKEGIANVSFRFEEGDWFITFDYSGALLEAEYVVRVTT